MKDLLLPAYETASRYHRKSANKDMAHPKGRIVIVKVVLLKAQHVMYPLSPLRFPQKNPLPDRNYSVNDSQNHRNHLSYKTTL